jgi:hypothetical protein
MATQVGAITATKNSNNSRFVVTAKHGNKILYRTVGMLFKSSKSAESDFIRTMRNYGVELPKGTVVEATPAEKR